MPFEKAAAMKAGLMGVAAVSRSTGGGNTQAAGKAYVELQTEEADWLEREAPEMLPGCDKLVISADGAMVPLLGGEWAEVKNNGPWGGQSRASRTGGWRCAGQKHIVLFQTGGCATV
jgi:hypothetical protein